MTDGTEDRICDTAARLKSNKTNFTSQLISHTGVWFRPSGNPGGCFSALSHLGFSESVIKQYRVATSGAVCLLHKSPPGVNFFAPGTILTRLGGGTLTSQFCVITT
jgi:hypothetical protein